MILSKQYLNELKDKKIVTSSINSYESRYKEVNNNYDIFLSYSSMNKEYAFMIFQLLEKHGYKVYIDINDKKLTKDKVDENTAKTLAKAMKKCKGLIYIHSSAATVSKWCPWELGFFSGYKNFMCANLPLNEKKNDKYTGQEYLNIYKSVEYSQVNNSNNYDFWIVTSERKSVRLKDWLNGKMKK